MVRDEVDEELNDTRSVSVEKIPTVHYQRLHKRKELNYLHPEAEPTGVPQESSTVTE